jgi:hypothetical protein
MPLQRFAQILMTLFDRDANIMCLKRLSAAVADWGAGRQKLAKFRGAAQMKRTLATISLTVAALVLPLLPAHAAGPYDGTWYVDAPAAQNAGTSERSSGCEPVRLPMQVTDNKITGTLQRSPYGTGRVEAGSGSTASPISGTVQPDGTFTAQWESYHATGKLSGDKAEMTWKGECGVRTATGGRSKQ